MNKSIEPFYRANYNNLVSRMTRSTGTVWDAEDVVHEAFRRLIQYFPDDLPEEDLPRWFNTVLNHVVIDHLNASRGVIMEEVDEFDWEHPEPLATDQVVRTVEALIEQEPEENQRVLELFFLDGYKAVEIYQFNTLSYANTRKIIERFRVKLRRILS